MATAIDLGALTLGSGPKVTLASGIVSQSGSGTDYTGWSDVSTVYVEAKCQLRDGSRGFARLVLTIEGSADGDSWSTLQTFTFGAGGSGAKQTATVSLTQDHLRAAWATTGAGEWNIEFVNVAPASINVAGGGGFDPVGCYLKADSLDIVSEATHDANWNHLYDDPWNTNTLAAIPDGLGLDFAFDGSSSSITTTEAGTWSFSIFGTAQGSAFRGYLRDGMLGHDVFSLVASLGDSYANLGRVYTLPDETELGPSIVTTATPGGGKIGIIELVIVRLG